MCVCALRIVMTATTFTHNYTPTCNYWHLCFLTARTTSNSSLRGDDDGAKRSKPDVNWEWHSDGGWKPFTAAVSQKLTTALKASKTDITFKVPGAEMKVVFADMEQRNTSTGYQRDVRCTSGNPSVKTCKKTNLSHVSSILFH